MNLFLHKGDPNGTTAYAGPGFEQNAYTGVQRATYSFNGQVVAVRNGATTSWLHSDHLGSASLATDYTGVPVAGSETRYTPWGEVRAGGVGAITDRGFTSQRREDNLRLNDYVAHFYNPFIGKFISPDSIVPGAGNPQAFNRYAMVFNNPLKFIDPTGHYACSEEGECRPTDNSNRASGSAHDVTSWLGRTLNSVAHGADILRMTLNKRFGQATRTVGGVTNELLAAADWKAHVQDRAVWDFKHKMRKEFQDTMVICGSGKCFGLDYSTAGNVTYGFWGMAIGFAESTLSLGAGYAEVHDPAHTEETQVMGMYGVGYYNPDWKDSYYDDPQDQAAIQLGVDLYNTYGPNITQGQFTDYVTKNLTKYGLAFKPIPTALTTSVDWPYTVDHFNGDQR